MITKDPTHEQIKEPVPDDDYHTLVTLLVILLIAVFVWLYMLTIKNKRKEEPGYVPKVLQADFMQRFKFVKNLRNVEQEGEKAAIMDEDDAEESRQPITIDEDQDVNRPSPEKKEEFGSVDPQPLLSEQL